MKTYTQLCSSDECIRWTERFSAGYTRKSYLQEYLYVMGEEELPFYTEQ